MLGRTIQGMNTSSNFAVHDMDDISNSRMGSAFSS